nr:radical SAM protein [Euryarchaeota archaeon]
MLREIEDNYPSCTLAGGESTIDRADDLAAQYPVVEIFHSVQGEGIKSGIPHVFIRFGNCNLRCQWCDTNFLKFKTLNAVEILQQVMQFKCKRIIFTGGEPMLNDLWPLHRLFKARGYELSCESNGTIEIPEGLLDWICISPKDQEYPNSKIRQRRGNELKCVYIGQELSMYDDLISGFDNLLLQPCYDHSKSVAWNGEKFAEVEEIVKQNPPWRLSLQTHKWMGVD